MKIKEVCNINQFTIESGNNRDVYDYLDTGNITDNVISEIQQFSEKSKLPSRAKRLVKSGDIIISTVRPIQRHYGYINSKLENLIVSTGFAVISPDENKINSKYLYYYLTKNRITNYLQMIAETAVSEYPSIKPELIGNMKIDFPDKNNQDSVVEVINIIDTNLKLNLTAISKLDEYIQLLIHKWFVDFNFPNIDGKPYKDSGGEMEEKNEQIIPKGWDIIPISRFAKIKTSSITPNKVKKYKYYTIPDFDKIGTYITEMGSNIGSDKYLVNNSNILVSKLNPWFNRVVYPYNIDQAICSTEFIVLEPLHNINEYLYALFNTKRFIKYCTYGSIGTSNSHKRVSPIFMMKYQVPFNEIQVNRFNEHIKPLVKKIHSLIYENRLLEETRDLLIKKLIR